MPEQKASMDEEILVGWPSFSCDRND